LTKKSSFEALVVRIGQSLGEREDLVALLRSSPLLDILPVIFCESEVPPTLPALSDLWTLPRVYTILPADSSLLLSVFRTLPFRSGGKAVREESRVRPSLSVLVAEDNEINRRVLLEILREAGHTVALANDGEEALDLLEESPDGVFNAMILDCNRPGRGGLDVLKAWRFMDLRSRVATMILTAAVTPEMEESCRRTGGDAFLAKPVDSRTLLDTLERIVREKGRKNTLPKGQLLKILRGSIPSFLERYPGSGAACPSFRISSAPSGK